MSDAFSCFLYSVKPLAGLLAKRLGKSSFELLRLRWHFRRAMCVAVARVAEDGLLERGLGKLDESFFGASEVQEEICRAFDPAVSFYPDIRELLRIHKATYQPEVMINPIEVEQGLERFLEYLYQEARGRPAIRKRLGEKEVIKAMPLTAAERDAVQTAHRSVYGRALAQECGFRSIVNARISPS